MAVQKHRPVVDALGHMYIVRPPRRVRPVVADVVLCPSVSPVVVVRFLSIRPVVSRRRGRSHLSVRLSRRPSRRRTSSVRPSRPPSTYYLHAA